MHKQVYIMGFDGRFYSHLYGWGVAVITGYKEAVETIVRGNLDAVIVTTLQHELEVCHTDYGPAVVYFRREEVTHEGPNIPEGFHVEYFRHIMAITDEFGRTPEDEMKKEAIKQFKRI